MTAFLYVHPSTPDLVQLLSLLHSEVTYVVDKNVYLKDIPTDVTKVGFLYHNKGAFPFKMESPNSMFYELKKSRPSIEAIDLLSCGVKLPHVDLALVQNSWLSIGGDVEVSASSVDMGGEHWKSTHVLVNGEVSEMEKNHVGVYVGLKIGEWNHKLAAVVDTDSSTNSFFTSLEKFGLGDVSVFDKGVTTDGSITNDDFKALNQDEVLHVFKVFDSRENNEFDYPDDSSEFFKLIYKNNIGQNVTTVDLFKNKEFTHSTGSYNGPLKIYDNGDLWVVVRDVDFDFVTADNVNLKKTLPHLDYYKLTKTSDDTTDPSTYDVSYTLYNLTLDANKKIPFSATTNTSYFAENFEPFKCELGYYKQDDSFGPYGGYHDSKYLFEYANKSGVTDDRVSRCPAQFLPNGEGLVNEDDAVVRELLDQYFEANEQFIEADNTKKYLLLQIVLNKSYNTDIDKDIWVQLTKITDNVIDSSPKKYSVKVIDTGSDTVSALFVLGDNVVGSTDDYDISVDTVFRVELLGNVETVINSDNNNEPYCNFISYTPGDYNASPKIDSGMNRIKVDFYNTPVGTHKLNMSREKYVKYNSASSTLETSGILTDFGASLQDNKTEETENCNVVTSSKYPSDGEFEKIFSGVSSELTSKCYTELSDITVDGIGNEMYMKLSTSVSSLGPNIGFEGNSGVSFINKDMLEDTTHNYVKMTLEFANGGDTTNGLLNISENKNIYFAMQGATKDDLNKLKLLINPSVGDFSSGDEVITEDHDIQDILKHFETSNIKKWNNMIITQHVWSTESGNMYSIMGYLVSLFKKIQLVGGADKIDHAQYNPKPFHYYGYNPSIELLGNFEIPTVTSLEDIHYFNLGSGSNGSDTFKLNDVLEYGEEYQLVSGLLDNGSPDIPAKVEFYRDVSGNELTKVLEMNLESHEKTDDFYETVFGHETNKRIYKLPQLDVDEFIIDSHVITSLANNSSSVFNSSDKTIDTFTMPSMSSFVTTLDKIVDSTKLTSSLTSIPTGIKISKLDSYKNSFSSKTVVMYIKNNTDNELFDLTFVLDKIPFTHTLTYNNKMLYLDLPLSFTELTFTLNLARINNINQTVLSDYDIVFNVFDNESNPKYREVEALRFTFDSKHDITGDIVNKDMLLLDFVNLEMKNWEENVNNIISKGNANTNSTFNGVSFNSNVSMTGYSEFTETDSYKYYTDGEKVVMYKQVGSNKYTKFDNRYSLVNFEKDTNDYSMFGVFSSELTLNEVHEKLNNVFTLGKPETRTNNHYICFVGKFLDAGLTNNLGNDDADDISIKAFHDEHKVRESGYVALSVDLTENDLVPTDTSGNMLTNNVELTTYEEDVLVSRNLVDTSVSLRLERVINASPDGTQTSYLHLREYKTGGVSYDSADISNSTSLASALPELLLIKNTMIPVSTGQLYKLTTDNDLTNPLLPLLTTFKYKLLNETDELHSNEDNHQYVVYLFNNGYNSMDIIDYTRRLIGTTDINDSNNTILSNISYTENEALSHVMGLDDGTRTDLIMEELTSYKKHEKNMELIKKGNTVIGSKLGDLTADDYDLGGLTNVIDTSETVTETPGMHMMFYISGLRRVDGGVEKFIVNRDVVDNRYNLTELLTNAISFKSYDQSVYVGNNTKQVIQLEQDLGVTNVKLNALLSEGSEDTPYEYGDYNENLQFIPSSTGFTFKSIGRVKNIDNIGVNIDNIEQCGVLSYQNINVPYEKHNGLTITLNNNLKFLVEKLNIDIDDIMRLDANMVVVPKTNIDINDKTKVDVTNINDINIITYNFDDNVRDSNSIICKNKTTLYQRINTDVNDSINQFGDPSEDLFISLMVDMFKSDRTTLVSPIVVLYKHPQISSVRNAIENDPQYISSSMDFTKSIMSMRRLCYYKYNTIDNRQVVASRAGIKKTYKLLWETNLTDGPDVGNMTLQQQSGVDHVTTTHRMKLKTGATSYDSDDKYNAVHKYLASSRSSDSFAVVWEIYKNGTDIMVCTYPSGYGHDSLSQANINDTLFEATTNTDMVVAYKTKLFTPYEDIYKHLDNKTGSDTDIQHITRESPLLNTFFNGYISDYDSKTYSITKDDPTRNLTERDLNGANAYLSNELYTIKNVDIVDCGHDNVQVETLYYFTSLLSRSLIDGVSNLTNAYWLLSDNDAGAFIDVPESITSVYNDVDDYLEIRAFRKAIVSVLYNGLTSNQEEFFDKFMNVSVPYNYMDSNEVYDGAHMVYILHKFRRSLISLRNVSKVVETCKFPIIWYDDEVNYYFTSKNYQTGDSDSNTKYDAVSKSFVHNVFGSEAYVLNLLADVAFHYESSTSSYIQNLKRYIKTMNAYRSVPETNIWFKKLDNEILGMNEYEAPYNVSLRQSTHIWHKYYMNSLRALFIFVNEGITKFINTSKIQKNGNMIDYKDYVLDLHKNTISGGSVLRLKSQFEKVPFTVDLSVKRIPDNLLMETTNFNIDGVEFAENTRLRLSILDLIGTPQQLFIPLMLEFETAEVEVIQSRKIEISTDYLLRALNKMPKLYLMNTIWYKVEKDANGTKTRKLVRVGDVNDMDNINGIPVLDVDYTEVESVRYENNRFDLGEYGLSTYMYDILMGKSGTGNYIEDETLIKDLLLQDDYGRLKLDDVRDDVTARGELKDFRYHGDRFDSSRNAPLFADNVPNTRGGFAMQVIRMIKSGLINKPEDIAILGNEQAIVNKIRNHLKDNTSNVPTDEVNSNYANIIQELNHQLTKVSDTEKTPMQAVIDQLYINDQQRFVVNEQLQKSSDYADKLGEVYMLPLTSDDTFTIITTVEGKLKDPFDGNSNKINSLLDKINNKLINPQDCNPIPDHDKTSIESISLTGTPINTLVKDTTVTPVTGTRSSSSEGVYKFCENVLVDPTIGPFEKNVADIKLDVTDNDYGKLINGKVHWVHPDGNVTDNGSKYFEASDVDINKYDAVVSDHETKFNGLLSTSSDQSISDKYLKLKERSFTVLYGLNDIRDTSSVSYQNYRENLTLSSMYDNGVRKFESKFFPTVDPMLKMSDEGVVFDTSGNIVIENSDGNTIDGFNFDYLVPSSETNLEDHLEKSTDDRRRFRLAVGDTDNMDIEGFVNTFIILELINKHRDDPSYTMSKFKKYAIMNIEIPVDIYKVRSFNTLVKIEFSAGTNVIDGNLEVSDFEYIDFVVMEHSDDIRLAMIENHKLPKVDEEIVAVKFGHRLNVSKENDNKDEFGFSFGVDIDGSPDITSNEAMNQVIDENNLEFTSSETLINPNNIDINDKINTKINENTP